MTKKILLYTFSLGALVLVTCMAIFFGLEYTHTMEDTYAALRGEASYAASGLEVGGIDYLKSLDNTNRVTWIDRDGSVLYDSDYPELSASQREFGEVRQALEQGAGQGVRKSSSGGRQTMYYAFLCGDGTVLRLSRPLSTVWDAFVAVSPALWVIVLILLISAASAYRIAQSIAKPVNEMDLGDSPGQPLASPYPELQPLVERLEEQKKTIGQQAAEREQIRREAIEQQARERVEHAQEQERMRREFTANVSHELKTPLTSISGFAELMRGGLCDEEKMIEFAGDIYRESQRLIALVNDIMQISELDEGLVDPEIGEVDLAAAAENVVRILQPEADRRRVKIGIRNLEEGVSIRGSHRLIDEMIYNLCDNAVKYNREGGSVTVTVGTDTEPDTEQKAGPGGSAAVTVGLDTEKKTETKAGPDGRVTVTAGTDTEPDGGKNGERRGRPFIAVEDTGIGIPEEDRDRVFERFYRVDKSHSRQMGGTGLGLSIVKHAARFHGADLSLESESERGTRITVRFPEPDGECEMNMKDAEVAEC